MPAEPGQDVLDASRHAVHHPLQTRRRRHARNDRRKVNRSRTVAVAADFVVDTRLVGHRLSLPPPVIRNPGTRMGRALMGRAIDGLLVPYELGGPRRDERCEGPLADVGAE